MDDPARNDNEVADDGDDVVDLMSISDESPTANARLRIEKEGFTVDIAVPSNALHLFDAAVTVLLLLTTAFGPVALLKALPADLPVWVEAGLTLVQLTVMILVAVRIYVKPGYSNRLSG